MDRPDRPEPAPVLGTLRQQLDERFQAELSRLTGTAAGVAGVSVIDLADGRRFGINDTQVFTQGSAIKIPILIELFCRADAGDLRLTEQLPIRTTDRVGGSGLLQYFGDGESSLSVGDLAIPITPDVRVAGKPGGLEGVVTARTTPYGARVPLDVVEGSR